MAATLIALEGAPPADALLAALAREAVTAAVVPLGALETAPGQLLLALAGPGTSDAALARIASLRGRSEGGFALLGFAPAGTQEDAERALAAGFDDFVVGRVSVREIALRLRALGRRLLAQPAAPREHVTLGRLMIDRARHQVAVDGQRTRVTAMELDVLLMLVDAGGRAISRADLLDRIWGSENLDVGQRAVDNLIMRLRKKLGDAEIIVTVRGHGFRIAA